jgi:hypothetical protein
VERFQAGPLRSQSLLPGVLTGSVLFVCITLSVYAHVPPTGDERAAEVMAEVLG